MFVSGVGNAPMDGRTRDKGFAFEIHAEPVAEFFSIRQCAPDSPTRRLDQDLSFNSIG
jgi:hypothetical protein